MDLVPQTRVSWGLGIRKSGQRSLHLLKCDYRGNVKYYSKTSRCLPEKVPFGQVRGFCFIFKPSMYTIGLLFTLFILTLNTTGYIYFHSLFIHFSSNFHFYQKHFYSLYFSLQKTNFRSFLLQPSHSMVKSVASNQSDDNVAILGLEGY